MYRRCICLAAVLFAFLNGLNAAEPGKPNFVIIFCDDLGYGDVGCFGSKTIKTPHIDRMAAEGMRLTNFYAQTVCGPSRAALLTGCYPLRVSRENRWTDIHPVVSASEITIAEVLKDVNYRSIAIGKWDIAGHSTTGYVPKLLPRFQGFETFFGTPTSNDRVAPLIRDEELIEPDSDMSLLTQRYTDEAISYIKQNKEVPFFVYLAHSMPHVRLAVSKAFKGKSAGGLYGDVVEEIDFHTGRIMQTLKDEGLAENTYVIFTSDNGPWYFGRSPGHKKRFGPNWAEHGGTATPLRGAKTSNWEGGLRVPCVAWAPGRIPANSVTDEVATTMDVLPTFAKLAGTRAPQDRVIDGHDIRDLIHAVPGTQSPTKAVYYYRRERLEAVRNGKWKLMLPNPADKTWAKYLKAEDVFDIAKPMLFDLNQDIGEITDVASEHPDVVAELLELADHARQDIGDGARG